MLAPSTLRQVLWEGEETVLDSHHFQEFSFSLDGTEPALLPLALVTMLAYSTAIASALLVSSTGRDLAGGGSSDGGAHGTRGLATEVGKGSGTNIAMLPTYGREH